MNNKKSIFLNLVFSILLQFFEIISTLIIPRLIIRTFGSEVNGLVSSLNQFLNYVALLEGGVASVMMANLYKPLLDGDNAKLSSIYVTMQRFFRRLSLIFVIFAFGVAGIYPLIVKSSFSWSYIFSLTLILALTLFIKYVFSMSNKLILNADNKIYITSIIQIVVVVLNIIFVYLIISYFPNIHIVKLATSLILLAQPVGYWLYIKKHYNINKKAQPDQGTIKQRWNGFAINIAHFIHDNTDIVVLTFLASLSWVSVYSVYLLVCQGIKSIIGAAISSFIPTLGKKIAAGDKDELNKFFDIFEFFSISISFLAYSLGWVLVVPFVSLYIGNIPDSSIYIQPLFAAVLMAAELAYSVREPYLHLEYNANHFKQISKYAFIEAGINIVVSISCVFLLRQTSVSPIVGVAIGTLVAMIYRTIATYSYMKKNLLDRSYLTLLKYVLTYLIVPVLAYFILGNISSFGMGFNSFSSIISFAGFAKTAICLIGSLYLVVTIVFHGKKIKRLMKYLRKGGNAV